MNVRIPYAKLKQAVIDSGMTYTQIKNEDWQFTLSSVLNPEEITKVKRLKNLVIRWLKLDFRERQYTGTIKAALFTRFDQMEDYLTLQGLSHLSGEEKLTRAFKDWKESKNG
jgi:hypothetical protein